MICQRCQEREATVHVLESRLGQRRNLWLCAECAAADELADLRESADDDDDRDEADDDPEPALGSFLGEVFALRADGDGRLPGACPGCRTTLQDLRRTNRLGCARCYVTFRSQLLPLLARFHRHVSHVGRVPATVRDGGSVAGEITRTRVALEKAVALEDFEQAALLRDRLRELEGEGRP